MSNLSSFSAGDAEAYTDAVGKIAADSASLEEAAGKIVRHLYDTLTGEGGAPACVLGRVNTKSQKLLYSEVWRSPSSNTAASSRSCPASAAM